MVDSFVVLAWTAIFCAKFSFLALFRLLIVAVTGRIKTYFWFVVGSTALTWVFVVVEPFILCPYFNEQAGMAFFAGCYSELN